MCVREASINFRDKKIFSPLKEKLSPLWWSPGIIELFKDENFFFYLRGNTSLAGNYISEDIPKKNLFFDNLGGIAHKSSK